jgi:large subunit ribosomal protein L15
MKLNSLPSTTTSRAKRLGRGYGSGKGGHTVGRGQKGQKSRGSVPAHFVGTSWVWFKRLPFLRGKSRFNALTTKLTLTLSDLNTLKGGTKVNKASLYQAGLLTKSELASAKVKIVNSGKLEKKLTVELPATKQAAEAIEKAGGTHRVQTS